MVFHDSLKCSHIALATPIGRHELKNYHCAYKCNEVGIGKCGIRNSNVHSCHKLAQMDGVAVQYSGSIQSAAAPELGKGDDHPRLRTNLLEHSSIVRSTWSIPTFQWLF